MKRRYFFGSLMFGLLFHSALQAQSRTPYERLAETFWNAPRRATLADFDANRWDRCVYYDVQAPTMPMPTHVRILNLGYAGRFDQRVDVFNDPIVSAHLPEFFNASHLVLNAGYFLQVLDGPGWLKTEIYGKLDRGTLIFHVARSNYGGPYAPVTPKAYGTCWNDRRGSYTQNDDVGGQDGEYGDEQSGYGEDDDTGTLPTPPPQAAPIKPKPQPPKQSAPTPKPPPQPQPQPPPPAPPRTAPPSSLPVPPPSTVPKPVLGDGDAASEPAKGALKVTSSVLATAPMPLPPPPGVDGK